MSYRSKKTSAPQWFAMKDAEAGHQVDVRQQPPMFEHAFDFIRTVSGDALRRGDRVLFDDDGKVWRDE